METDGTFGTTYLVVTVRDGRIRSWRDYRSPLGAEAPAADSVGSDR